MALSNLESLTAADLHVVLALIQLLSARVAAELQRTARHQSQASIALTPREIEILGWVEHGMSNADIATLCGTSIRTVHKHLQNVFAKLNVENRSTAVRRWRDLRELMRRRDFQSPALTTSGIEVLLVTQY